MIEKGKSERKTDLRERGGILKTRVVLDNALSIGHWFKGRNSGSVTILAIDER